MDVAIATPGRVLGLMKKNITVMDRGNIACTTNAEFFCLQVNSSFLNGHLFSILHLSDDPLLETE